MVVSLCMWRCGGLEKFLGCSLRLPVDSWDWLQRHPFVLCFFILLFKYHATGHLG